jgi:diguanylate cyclase (GGDEF)-like protein
MPAEWRILVVDDEEAILDTYRHYLAPDLDPYVVRSARMAATRPGAEKEHYQIVAATSGEQALVLMQTELAAGRRVPCAFFDMKMPGGIDGLETMRRARALDADLLCCVVTAHQEYSIDEINRLFAGGHEDEWDYLNKPFTEAEIRQKARNMIWSWRRRRSQEQHGEDLSSAIAVTGELRRMPEADHAATHDLVLRRVRDLAGGARGFVATPGLPPTILASGGENPTELARLIEAPALAAALARAARERTPESGDQFSILPLGGAPLAPVAVLLHSRPLALEKHKLLRILTESLAVTMDNRRLVDELRRANGRLEQRVDEQMTELRKTHAALAEAARTDTLTGAGNRLRMREDLDALAASWARRAEPWCCSVYDVDRFKAYNDRHGHMAGDEALRAVAAAIRTALGTSGSLYRWGGEEFLVLLPGQSLELATAILERGRKAVEACAIPHRDCPAGVVTVSAGVAAIKTGETDPVERGLRRADRALYAAKRAGGNRVLAWDAARDADQDGAQDGAQDQDHGRVEPPA